MTKKRPDLQVTCQKTPSSERGRRPKGSGEGLTVPVGTKLRPDEITTLDKITRQVGRSRAELIRTWIRIGMGV